MIITQDQILLEGIIFWSEDLTKKLIDFTPRMELNLKLFQQEVKERLNKLFVKVDPNYARVAKCTRLRWIYFEFKSILSLSVEGIQLTCFEDCKVDFTKQIKIFTTDEILKMQSEDGRAFLTNEIISQERIIFEAHREQLLIDRRNLIQNLRDQLEKLESEIV